MSLQSFPRAVFYNRERQLFELRSDAKRRLTRELKAGVRLSKKRNGELYRTIHNNSFGPTGVVPLVNPSLELNRCPTTYAVQVLYFLVRIQNTD